MTQKTDEELKDLWETTVQEVEITKDRDTYLFYDIHCQRFINAIRTVEIPIISELTAAQERVKELEADIKVYKFTSNNLFEQKKAIVEIYEAKLEQVREPFRQINDWTKAYPIDISPEPDLQKAREVLEKNGMTLDSISAHAMRYVVNGIAEIINQSDLDKVLESQ